MIERIEPCATSLPGVKLRSSPSHTFNISWRNNGLGCVVLTFCKSLSASVSGTWIEEKA